MDLTGDDENESAAYGMMGEILSDDGSSLRFRKPVTFSGDSAFAAPALPANGTSTSLWVNIPSTAYLAASASTTASLRPRAYLAGYEFSGKDLSDASAFGSDLRGTVLSGSNLSNANLQYARLSQEHVSRDVDFYRAEGARTG